MKKILTFLPHNPSPPFAPELLRRKAIKRLKIENAAALQIQRIVRGMLGRKRFKYFDEIRQSFRENQKKAFDRICRLFYPVVLGFVTRKHWVPIIQVSRQITHL